MSETVTPLRTGDEVYLTYLTEDERHKMKTLTSLPGTSGFIMFDKTAEVIASDNVADISAAVFANIFDAAESLGAHMGQSVHHSVTFENKQQEIICHRWTRANLVVVRGKAGN
jgi:predicted regulator of Ras-like GTPase activity (Roadblock/LC7/MglB family)